MFFCSLYYSILCRWMSTAGLFGSLHFRLEEIIFKGFRHKEWVCTYLLVSNNYPELRLQAKKCHEWPNIHKHYKHSAVWGQDNTVHTKTTQGGCIPTLNIKKASFLCSERTPTFPSLSADTNLIFKDSIILGYQKFGVDNFLMDLKTALWILRVLVWILKKSCQLDSSSFSVDPSKCFHFKEIAHTCRNKCELRVGCSFFEVETRYYRTLLNSRIFSRFSYPPL